MLVTGRTCLRIAAALCVATHGASAQVPVKLSAVLTTFLADSGVQTRGLPWTTGDKLPIKWETPKPVAVSPSTRPEGISLTRVGAMRLNAGKKFPVEMSLVLEGNDIGLQRVSVAVALDANELTKEQLKKLLTDDGIVLGPLKCDPQKEGASYGNLVYTVKAPGKTMSGLHENWNCPRDGCMWALSLLYRRADVAKVECYTG